jgi:ParB/RepB/Spo0J family partition protein
LSAQTMKVVMLAVAMLQPHEKNPGKAREGNNLQELKLDVLRRGILVPLLVRRNGDVYQIVDGHRRHAVAILAGLECVPCIVFGDEVTETQVREIQLVTQLQSEALSPYCVYLGIKNLQELQPDATGADLAKAISRSESYVSTVLSLDRLIQPLKDRARDGKIGLRQWYMLSKLSPGKQAEKLNGHHQAGEHETVKVTKISCCVPGKKAKLTISGKEISLVQAIDIVQEWLRLAKKATEEGVSAKSFERVCRDKAKMG